MVTTSPIFKIKEVVGDTTFIIVSMSDGSVLMKVRRVEGDSVKTRFSDLDSFKTEYLAQRNPVKEQMKENYVSTIKAQVNSPQGVYTVGCKDVGRAVYVKVSKEGFEDEVVTLEQLGNFWQLCNELAYRDIKEIVREREVRQMEIKPLGADEYVTAWQHY